MLCKVIFFDSHNKQEGRFISIFNWRSWNIEGWVVVVVQVAKSYPTLCSLMDCSTPGSSVLHQVPELAQIHVHWVSDGCHPTISSSVVPFSSCLQSFPASGSFPMSWLFTSGGQSIGASALATVLSINIQGWFPSGWTDLISLQSKGLSRLSSNTTVQKHQFFGS